MKIAAHLTVVASLVTLAVGCEQPKLPSTKSAAPAVAAPEPEAPPMVAGAPGKELPETEVPVTDIPRKVLPTDPVQGRRLRREAKEGTNVAGLGTTLGAGVWAKHQLLYLNIEKQLPVYAATHNFEMPKTQEEFMEEVVKPSVGPEGLPKLQDDHEYCYVPSQAERGLQIRLVPGSPKSKVPAGTSPEDALKLLEAEVKAAEEAAKAETPAPGAGEQPADPAASTTPEPESGRDEAGNPLDLRERAAGIGGPVLDQ